MSLSISEQKQRALVQAVEARWAYFAVRTSSLPIAYIVDSVRDAVRFMSHADDDIANSTIDYLVHKYVTVPQAKADLAAQANFDLRQDDDDLDKRIDALLMQAHTNVAK